MLRWKLEKLAEKLLIKIVWRLPRTMVMWCAIRVGAHATNGKWSSQEVPALSFIDAIQRWDDKPWDDKPWDDQA